MEPLVVRLSRHVWLHRVVGTLRIYPLAGFLLRRLPLRRRMKDCGLRYRVTSLDQLITEHELFGAQTYLPALGDRAIETFADIGCNSGWFALWLACIRPNGGRMGLLVDAHPWMAAEAAWHVKENRLGNLVVVRGAVGRPASATTADFYVQPASSGSSLLPHQPRMQLPLKGKQMRLVVPTVSVEQAWRSAFEGRHIDLLKVDIEGSELDLFRTEEAFISKTVAHIVVEWHKWSVGLPELDLQLGRMGFDRTGVFHETSLAGLAAYDRRS